MMYVGRPVTLFAIPLAADQTFEVTAHHACSGLWTTSLCTFVIIGWRRFVLNNIGTPNLSTQ